MSRFTRRIAALTATLLGLGLLVFTFAGAASAWSATEDGTPTCQQGNAGDWVANFTVHNDPNASFGPGLISGTGTSLDGKSLAAGGGTLSVSINEPHAKTSATVSGTVTWNSGEESAPFTHTETIPPSCVVTTPTPTPTTPTPTPTHTHSPGHSSTPPVTSTAPAAAVSTGTPPLASTGADSSLLISVAGALIVGGLALFAFGRRPRRGH